MTRIRWTFLIPIIAAFAALVSLIAPQWSSAQTGTEGTGGTGGTIPEPTVEVPTPEPPTPVPPTPTATPDVAATRHAEVMTRIDALEDEAQNRDGVLFDEFTAALATTQAELKEENDQNGREIRNLRNEVDDTIIPQLNGIETDIESVLQIVQEMQATGFSEEEIDTLLAGWAAAMELADDAADVVHALHAWVANNPEITLIHDVSSLPTPAPAPAPVPAPVIQDCYKCTIGG